MALETLLDHLENADAYLKKAKEAYENAVEEHRLALENVAREEAKLKIFLQDQLDATAQYEAVREAYLNTRTRQSQVFNDKSRSQDDFSESCVRKEYTRKYF